MWLAVALAISGSAFAGDLDTVFLKDGGRIRGTVMVEDPKDGVQIKLPDGTVRSLKSAAVVRVEYGKSEAPPAPTPSAAPAAPPPVSTPSATPAAPASATATTCPQQVVECSCEGNTTGTRPCDPATGQLMACQCPVVRRSSGMMVGGIVLSSVGGAGVLAGVGVLVMSALSRNSNDEREMSRVAGVMLGLSGATMTTGIVLAAVGGKKKKGSPQPPERDASVVVTPTLNGLVVSGSF